jgi:hypothetical protein
MTEVFGWEVEYEPTIEGLRGWLPDFLIKGCQRDILVEVKPIRCLEEWENHPDYGKVINSEKVNYYDHPWEIEAHGRERGLFYRWVEQSRWKNCKWIKN